MTTLRQPTFPFDGARLPTVVTCRVTDRKLCLHPRQRLNGIRSFLLLHAEQWSRRAKPAATGQSTTSHVAEERGSPSYPSYPRFVFLAAADSEDEEGGQAARPDRSSRRHVAARSWSAHPGSFCVPCQAHDFAHEFAAAVRSALAAAMPSFVGLPRAMPPLQQSVERYHKNLSSRSRRPRRRYKDGQRRWQASLQPSR